MVSETTKIKEQNEKRCVLCNKPYDYKYQMFGRGCVDNLYTLLEIKKTPRIISDKELYLCTRIAWRNHKFFLNKNKKYALAQDYIALNYLNKMDLEFLEDTKEKISSDIRKISAFSKNNVRNVPFELNDVYQVFNYYQKFEEIINKTKNVNWKDIDEQTVNSFIESLKFIFDVNKKANPISYVIFYAMQYAFWQIVVAGGILTSKKLSAKLLLNSLSPLGKDSKDLLINDEETIKKIKESKEFNEKIKEIIEKYCKDSNKFSGNSKNNEDCKIEFNDEDNDNNQKNNDLFYAIHGASTNIELEKNEDETWNINMKIEDTYDFTDFKNLKKYVKSNKNLYTSVFSSTLNNFAVVSSEYGVIKPYKIIINIQENNYKVK